MTQARPRVSRKKTRLPLSRERVLAAAVRLADEKGIEALSMRNLASVLGVEAMSLYKHVAHKDALLDGITDLVVAEIAVPEIGGDWRAEIKKRATSAHEVLLRHPWATMLIGSRINVGPAMLRYVNATLGCLREAGFSFELADRAWNAIDSHIYGFTLLQLNFPLEVSEYASAASQFLFMLPVEKYPYMRALTELVIEGKHRGIQDFQFGLEMLLDGLEAHRVAHVAAK